jgi:hypothetical protein
MESRKHNKRRLPKTFCLANSSPCGFFFRALFHAIQLFLLLFEAPQQHGKSTLKRCEKFRGEASINWHKFSDWSGRGHGKVFFPTIKLSKQKLHRKIIELTEK